MYKDLLFESTPDGVGVLTINKERSMNVLNGDTVGQLKELCDRKAAH